MRKSLSIILAVLFVGLGAPAAFADTYTINFTVTFGIPAPSGAFTWDGTSFSNFIVNWDGFSFDLTSAANAPIVTGTQCGTSSAAASFALLNGTVVCSPNNTPTPLWKSDSSIDFLGQFAFIETSLPGPSNSEILITAQQAGLSNAPSNNPEGTWTIADTTVATPEPGTLSSLSLGMVGLGLCWWMTRKREARGLQSAT